jgi:hypothetical protein
MAKDIESGGLGAYDAGSGPEGRAQCGLSSQYWSRRFFGLMPLFANAAALIRTNLEQIADGGRATLVPIGTLTQEQLEAINKHRLEQGLAPISAEVVFIGRHIYESRVMADGYSVQDVIEQISNAMDSRALVLESRKMTAMENPQAREDRYGNYVNDRAIFECTARHPRPELFSVVPKGDLIKPKTKKGPPPSGDGPSCL